MLDIQKILLFCGNVVSDREGKTKEMQSHSQNRINHANTIIYPEIQICALCHEMELVF